MTFTKTGTDTYRNVSSGQGSWTLNSGTVNDLRIIGNMVESSTITVSTVSGGGVAAWNLAGTVFSTGSNRKLDIWYGSINSAGTALTLTYSSAIGSTVVRGWMMDFRSSLPGTRNWQMLSQTTITNASSTTVTFPTQNTQGADSLYVSVGHVANTASAGSTPGFSYVIDVNGNPRCWNLACAATTAVNATCTQSPAGASYFTSALFTEGPIVGNELITTNNEAVNRASVW